MALEPEARPDSNEVNQAASSMYNHFEALFKQHRTQSSNNNLHKSL